FHLGVARADRGAGWRRRLHRWRQRLDRVVGDEVERSALRDRTGSSLPDADRSHTVRRRLSAEPDSWPARQRSAANPSRAVPLQYRAGVLTMSIVRRLAHVLIIV